MKLRGDIESVNLATGERFQRVSGEGESRLERCEHIDHIRLGPLPPPTPEEIAERVQELVDAVKSKLEEQKMSTRCKFYCVSKREYQNWDRNKANLYEYEFSAVTSGSEENKSFFEATPSGTLKVSTVKDGTFIVGKNYYLDLNMAE